MTKVNGTNLGQLQQEVKQLYENFRSSLRGNEYKHNPLYLGICLQNNTKNPNDISLEEFKKSYSQLHVPEPKSLAQHIEKLFMDYWIDKVELQAKGYREEKIINSINKAPWELLDEIIEISGLPLKFNNPFGLPIREEFKLIPHNTRINQEINFDELSSGEQAIISTLFYVCTVENKAALPRLLLLDEPDAHLHPSMAKQFLQVIKEYFVGKHGIRVIMTTHSPSTVLFLPT